MRRFNYTSFVTPEDPKRQRNELYGKFRTEASNPHDVAAEFLADFHDATLLHVDGKIDSKVLAKNKLNFTFTFIEPYPSSVLVEMQEVEEGSKKAKMLYWAVYNFGPRWPAPGEPRLYGLRSAAEAELDEEMVQRATEYFEEHDPSLDEIESLSVEGGPLELEADDAPIISNEAPN